LDHIEAADRMGDRTQVLEPQLVRSFLPRLADYLVVAVAVSLPWSTSATSILVLLWLLALIPTLDFAALRRELMTPAGGLPVVLWLFAVIGMFWADVTWAERLYGLRPYHKLLAIPLLLVQFRQSEVGWYALTGFLASCMALLICSWVLAFWPALNWHPQRAPGIPVKDKIVQSTEFMIAVAVLVHLVYAVDARRRWLAFALAGLALLFLANILFVATARTALVVLPCLLVLVGFQRFGLRGAAALLAAGLVVASVVALTSPGLRDRLASPFEELDAFRSHNPVTSGGLRLEYWRQSLGFMTEAPLIGHGTGSTRNLSIETIREEGVTERAAIPHNPHNQALAVGVQLGMVGTTLLFAMWLAHFALFRGQGLLPWIGVIVVFQNVAASAFNSHLFDFTPGWLYVFGIGVLGGMMRGGEMRARARA
jgi:O-antigen ligase